MTSWKRTYATLAASAAALVIAVGAALSIDRSASVEPTFVCGTERLTEPQIAAKFGVSVETMRRAQSTSSVTIAALCTMRPELAARALRKADTPKNDHPGEAVEFRNLFYRNEDGTIPEDGLVRAKAELEQLKNTPGMVAAGAGISSGAWTALGPGNIGGRIRTMIIDPAATTTMLIGSVSGGIWRTTNGGTTWAPVNDFLANLAVTTLVALPSTFNTQYAGTGEGFYNADGIRGNGIFKSVDGGVTWTSLAATTNSNFQYVNRLAVSSNSARVLAATRTNIYRSDDGGTSWPAAVTLPGGAGAGVADVDFHPTDPLRAVAGGYSGNAWYSVDGGANWIAATGLPGGSFIRVETAYARSAPNIVYASIDTTGGALYRSVDNGATYTLVYGGATVGHFDYLGGQGWYDNALWVDPTNSDRVIVGGIDLFRSINGGTSFTQISTWWAWPASAHADHHYIVEVPGYNGTSNTSAFFLNDGGVYGTSNILTVGNNAVEPFTNGWQEYNNNLAITQFYGAGAHDATGKVVGGTQDNGTLTYTTGSGFEGWVFMFGGDGGFSAIDQTNPNYCYGEYVYLRIHRSTSGCGAGTSAYIYTSGLTDAVSLLANFIAPFILDPNNQSRLLGGGRSLWRTNDAKAAPVAWTAIKSPLVSGSNISAIAVQLGNSDHIWVGHNNGDVYQTTNGTNALPTWSANKDAGLPNRVVTRIAVDPNDPNVIYATFGGYASDNIWKSINGGTSWTNIHGSLPAAPIRSIAIHPSNSSWLYIGTEIGIFTSETAGASWTIPHDGPSNVSVDEVFFSGTTLYAATHGRGVYKASTGLSTPGKATLISPSGYVNDTTPTYRWNSVAGATWYYLWVDDPTGTRIQTWYTSTEAGCAAGGICQITPATALNPGVSRFWIQTWNSAGYGPWSDPTLFDVGPPSASVVGTYPVSDTQPGYSAALWVQVRNNGPFALPAGSQAWVYVSGPGGLSEFVGFVNVTGLGAGATQWYLFSWDVPVGRAAGTHTYWGIVWSTTYSAYVSTWSGAQTFQVLATPASAARIISTYDINNAVQGGTARMWALVRNIGTNPLNSRVWFYVYTVGWIGSSEITGLASGAEAWVYVDWPIPGARPVGAHWYLAQAWNSTSTVALSPESAWQAFTVGFNAPFTTGFDGFAAVTGAWEHQASNYLFTAGVPGQFSTVQYAGSTFSNFDYSATIWRNGDGGWYHGIYGRGTPSASFWSNGYLVLIARVGQYSVLKYQSGAFTIIQNWTASSALVTGSAWNTLRLIGGGSSLWLYINGTLVWNGTDTAFTSGHVGIGAFRSTSAADASGFGFWVDSATLTGFGSPGPNREGEATKPPMITDTISPEQEALNKEANRNNDGRTFTDVPPPAAATPRRPDTN